MSEQKRANPDRIDFQVLTQGVMVTKYDRRDIIDRDGKPAVRSIPWLEGCELKDWDEDKLDWALTWCEENNYEVRRFPGGARAFKGEKWVIRTKGQIKRKHLDRMRRMEAGATDAGYFYDLRYDLF